MTSLDSRVAIVTGAARGIGHGIARALAAEGASVVVADRDLPGAERVAEELDGAVAVGVDVSVEEDVRGLVDATLAAFGRIDVLVNNAGLASASPLGETTLDEWNRVLAVDLTGVFLCSRAVVPTMAEQASGAIVNIGSQLGLRGAPNLAAYCAAKAGVHGLTKALARELAPLGIRVNAVAPGPVDTRSSTTSTRRRWPASSRRSRSAGSHAWRRSFRSSCSSRATPARTSPARSSTFPEDT